jgi:hypothetical protein
MLEANEAFIAPCPLQSLQEKWTPLFQSGILISRKTWFGGTVAWIWNVASHLHIADEKSAFKKIVQKSESFFRSASKPDTTESKLLRTYTLSPQYAEKASLMAMSILHCTLEEWEASFVTEKSEFCLNLLSDMTSLPMPKEAIVNSPQKKEVKEWIKEMHRIFPSLDSTFLWNAFRALYPNSENETQAILLSFSLYKQGFSLLHHQDSVRKPLPEGIVIKAGAQKLKLPDSRFYCWPLEVPDKYLLLMVDNSFLIPIWRAHTSQSQTLFKVVLCHHIDPSNHWALLEGVIGKVRDLLDGRNEWQNKIIEGLVNTCRSWISSRLCFTPKEEDLWFSSSKELVTFAPCVLDEQKVYSLLHIESFLNEILPANASSIRRYIFQEISFFSQKECRVVESLLLQEGLFCSERRIQEELAFQNIQDLVLQQRLCALLSELRSSLPSYGEDASLGRTLMRRYLQLAHQEGFFFYPPESALRRII